MESNCHAPIHVCGVDIAGFSKVHQLITCTVSIFILYLAYGALQEVIFTSNHMKSHSVFLTCYQFSIYAALAGLELKFRSVKLSSYSKHLLPYAVIGLLAVGTIAFSNAAVAYLNYPTQVLFKSCKIIPVMIGGVLIQRKKYSSLDVLAVLLMTAGLIAFTMIDVAIQPTFTLVGVILILIALASDGFLGNLQEIILKTYGSSSIELIFYSYCFGFLYLLMALTVTGSLVPSLQFFLTHPLMTFGLGFLFSFTGYFGMQFVLALVHSHGALTAITVTTCRKAFSIMLSFMMFQKPFSHGYIWSGLLVVAGVYVNLYSKNRVAWNIACMKYVPYIKVNEKSPILPV